MILLTLADLLARLAAAIITGLLVLHEIVQAFRPIYYRITHLQ
jgi:hypothetical protein